MAVPFTSSSHPPAPDGTATAKNRDRGHGETNDPHREAPHHERTYSGVSPAANRSGARRAHSEGPDGLELDIAIDESASDVLRTPLIPADFASTISAPWHSHESGERPILDPARKRSDLVSWRPSAALPAVTTYGRFDVLGSIGRGGMAEILLARERSSSGMSRHVVLKRILPTAADDAEYVRMFQEEARLMMALTHPNLCHVYDFGEEGGTWYIAMEWVNGVSLARIVRGMRDRGGLPWQIAARVIAHVAEAVSYAHNARDASGRPLGLVHRDVSPQNIMIAYDGTVKLLDFGIAKATAHGELTTSGLVKGKLPYMAPEQLSNSAIDARTDVFSLGVCLYEALTGQSLYARESEIETLRAMLQGAPPSVCSMSADIPLRLDRIVRTALEKDPDDRFQSAHEMQLALEEHLIEERQMVNAARVASFIRDQFPEQLRSGPTLGGVIEIRSPGSVPDASQIGTEEDRELDALIAKSLAPPKSSRRIPMLVAFIVAALAIALGPLLLSKANPIENISGKETRRETTRVVTTQPAHAPRAQPAQAHQHQQPTEQTAAIAPRKASRPAASRKRAPVADAPMGRISINTRPWSKVYLGRRLLGTTPIAEARVPSGRVPLRFVDRDGETHHKQARVETGRSAELFFDLRSSN